MNTIRGALNAQCWINEPPPKKTYRKLYSTPGKLYRQWKIGDNKKKMEKEDMSEHRI